MNPTLALSDEQSAALSVEGVTHEAAAMLRECVEPAFVVHLPTAAIVAASPSASRLLDPSAGEVVGRRLDEFTSDDPSGALDLFAAGRITGFEVIGALRRPGGGDDLKVHLWYRLFDHQISSRFALVLISTDEMSWGGWKSEPGSGASAVCGVTGRSQLIERISGETFELFGSVASALIGEPLRRLAAQGDVENWLTAIEKSSQSGQAVTLALNARGKVGNDSSSAVPVPCAALILPLSTIPGFSFVFVPSSSLFGQSFAAEGLSALLLRLARVADFFHPEHPIVAELTDRGVPGLTQLSARELEVLTRLHAGFRVTGIATELFLSTSTVRSHLASIFAKLGVSNQEQLLTVLREPRSSLGHSDRYPSFDAVETVNPT
jgi:DNA-binding CsgD family transcriptional regulator